MNDTTKLFLAILQAALRNASPLIEGEITITEWQTLLRMASIHNVLPLFYEAVYALPALAEQDELLTATKQQVRQQIIMQAIRTEEFLALNDRLQHAGAKPLVVKGIICRNLYPRPDHRPSSDEDVLIPPEQFSICHPVLTEFGMTTGELFDAYELPYRKENSPLLIELHKSLFPPDSDAYGDLNRFFEDARERAIAMEIQGHTVYTLNHTDHLFYLICHAFKHFLHSGFGIRQVCDIVLYANAYGSQVDWERVLENCKAIRGEKFAAAIFLIGQKYLIFEPEAAAYSPAWREIQVDEMPMLEDLLTAGLYGGSSMSRKHSSNITLDAVTAQKTGKKTKNALVASLFPPRAKLEGRYPYLKKHRYLLPVAWCSRLWTYGKETKNSRDNTASDALKIGNERVELMKLYGILESSK